MTTIELLKHLGADDAGERIRAIVWAKERGSAGAIALVSVLVHRDAGTLAKVWAMIGIAQLGPTVLEITREALHARLADGSPTVRRTAIQALVALRDQSSRADITALVDDHELDPSAWLDDDCTVSQAAVIGLKALDSPSS